MIIQLIGLPCSGKTHVINKIKLSGLSINFFNLTAYTGLDRESRMLKDVKLANKQTSLTIVESACGLENLNSIVVMLRVSNQQLKSNQIKRQYNLSSKTTYDIIGQMLPPTYTAYSTRSCRTLIETIIKMEFPHVSDSERNSYTKNN